VCVCVHDKSRPSFGSSILYYFPLDSYHHRISNNLGIQNCNDQNWETTKPELSCKIHQLGRAGNTRTVPNQAADCVELVRIASVESYNQPTVSAVV
jgi:hypothetical protein